MFLTESTNLTLSNKTTVFYPATSFVPFFSICWRMGMLKHWQKWDVLHIQLIWGVIKMTSLQSATLHISGFILLLL